MAFVCSINRSVYVNNTDYGGTAAVNVEVPIVYKETIANGQTNKALTIACDVSVVTLISITATRIMTLTLYSAVPTLLKTFNLKANQTLAWTTGENALPWTGDDTACPFGATDVAQIKVTNASGSDGVLSIAIGQNATP